MPSSKSLELEFSLEGSISEIDPILWDRCAGKDNPFLAHSFFKALEDSACVGEGTGWEPHPLLARDREGEIRAVLPLYAKTHSYGEYVFDWAWAEAYEKAGGRYYPKWQGGVPFTPVPGPRLLGSCKKETALALRQICDQTGFSSAHVTFLEEGDKRVLEDAGFLLRKGSQYHWHNRGYRDFQDFLDALNSRKRKMIRKERQHLKDLKIDMVALSGSDLMEHHWDFFFRCYVQNARNKWGRPYLTREFFSMLGQSMGERLVLILARRDGKDIAAALNFLGTDALYGRNWGALEGHSFLHFETCYYAAIDYAIAKGLARVEAGAQGEHKIQRGYEPVATYSAHYIADARLRSAIADFLKREEAVMEHQMEELRLYIPYGRAEKSGEA